MRALIDWSYDLLSDNEQRVFRKLSIFAGGFTLETAALCAKRANDEIMVLDLLSSLVDKSLVQADLIGNDTRYRLWNRRGNTRARNSGARGRKRRGASSMHGRFLGSRSSSSMTGRSHRIASGMRKPNRNWKNFTAALQAGQLRRGVTCCSDNG